ncbi:membrane permease, partial [Alcaligenes sp. HPC1271]
MIATLLFVIFIGLMLVGVPVGVSLGIGGAFAILMSNLDTHWFGLMAVPQSFMPVW